MLISRHFVNFGLLALGAVAPAQSAPATARDDAPASATAVLVARDLDGVGIKDASLLVRTEDHPAPFKLQTNQFGMARFPVSSADALESVEINVQGDAYKLVAPPETRRADGSGQAFLFVQLLPSDYARMNKAERSAYIAAQPLVFAKRWAAGQVPPPEAPPTHPLRLAALLRGFGTERIPTMEEVRAALAEQAATPTPAPPAGADAPTPTPRAGAALLVRLVDTTGAPIAGRPVVAMTAADQGGETEMAGKGTTSGNGFVPFFVEPGQLVRPMAESIGGSPSAQGGFVLVAEDIRRGQRMERTLVLRPDDRRLSGVVFEGDAPARDVLLRTMHPNQPRIEVRTDEFGYFEIAPLQPGTTDLEVVDPATNDIGVFTTTVGAQAELFVPLEVLFPQKAGTP